MSSACHMHCNCGNPVLLTLACVFCIASLSLYNLWFHKFNSVADFTEEPNPQGRRNASYIEKSNRRDYCNMSWPRFTYPPYFNHVELSHYQKQVGIPWHQIPNQTFSDVGFLRFFTKLESGQDLLILVLGGSATIGHDCRTPTGLQGKECAWPAQLANWFQLFASHVKVENLAIPGTTSKMMLPLLGAYSFRYPQPDMVIIDYLVNDAYGSGTQPNPGGGELNSVSVVYERLLRALSEVYPQVAIMSFEAGCPTCASWSSAHVDVLVHYGILTVDYNQILKVSINKHSSNKQWGKLWSGSIHPDWYAHVYIADAIAFGIQQKLQELCTLRPALNGPLIHDAPPYHSTQDLSKLPVCKIPSSWYYSYNVNASSDLPTIHKDGFVLREDRPGKPGWISITPGSRITFPIRFGGQPIICVTFLRSYEGMANATLRLAEANCSVNLPGLWRKRASLLETTCFNASAKSDWNRFVLSGAHRECGFSQKPNTATTLSLEHSGHLGQQFKVVSVISC